MITIHIYTYSISFSQLVFDLLHCPRDKIIFACSRTFSMYMDMKKVTKLVKQKKLKIFN